MSVLTELVRVRQERNEWKETAILLQRDLINLTQDVRDWIEDEFSTLDDLRDMMEDNG